MPHQSARLAITDFWAHMLGGPKWHTAAAAAAWSQKLRHDFGVAAVLAMSPAQRKSFFDGVMDVDGRKERDVTDHRGTAAVVTIRTAMYRVDELQQAKNPTCSPSRPSSRTRSPSSCFGLWRKPSVCPMKPRLQVGSQPAMHSSRASRAQRTLSVHRSRKPLSSCPG